MRLRTLAAGAAAALAASCSSSSTPPTAGPPASASRSDVALSAGSVAADGATPALVTVTVRDAQGAPLAGAPVSVAYPGGTVAPVSPTTDAKGTATFRVTASAPTAGSVVATASGTPLADQPALAFHGCAWGFFVSGACAPPPFVLLPPAVPASWGGVGPDAFAVADLDGNGLDDVAVADPEGGAIQVLVSYGGGRFAPSARMQTIGGRNAGVVAADVTGDAIVDVVTMVDPGRASASLFVLPGTGDGTLQPARITALPEYLSLAAGADLDGDGDVDLVARVQGGVGALLNDGAGGFGPLARSSAGFSVPMPSALAVADLNADGAPDAVAAYEAAGEVEVRLGRGDGTFGAPARYAVGISPSGVGAGDVDGDGRLDVVTSNWGASTATAVPSDVSVLLGNGDGTLGASAAFRAGRSPNGVAVADLDRDGLADVVTADANGATVTVLRGAGGGALGPPESYVSPGIPWAVAVAAVEPGHPDDVVVLEVTAGTVTALLGRGNAQLAAPVQPPFANRPVAVAAADLNGDGAADLVAASNSTEKITVALGNGDGSFRTSVEYDAPGDPANGRALAAGDLDGDGDDDVVLLNKRTQQLSVLLADRGPLAVDATYSVTGRAEGAALGDLDRDGKLDVVVVNPGATIAAESTMSVFLGTGGGLLAPEVSVPVGGYTWAVALADLDRDGDLDAALAGWDLTADGNTSELRVLAGDGAGGFAAPVVLSRPAAPGSWFGRPSLALGDLDRDGDLDAVASDGTDLVLTYAGNADGTFAPAAASASGVTISSVALGDVDGDGTTDAVASGGGLLVLRGRGDGTFSAGAPYKGWPSAWSVAVADLDGDAFADIVATEWARNVLGVLLGSSSGPSGWAPVPVGVSPTDLAVVDLDHDGALDLVAASYYGAGLGVALGRGDATFRAPASLEVDGYPTSVGVADLNGDGEHDAVLTHLWCTGDVGGAPTCTSTLGVLLGAGDGTFGPERLFEAGEGASDAALGDVNGDGAIDAVVTGPTAALLLAGNGDGTFAAPVALPTAPPAEALLPPWPDAQPIAAPRCVAVALADLNADGRLDLAAANSSALDVAGFRIDEVAILVGNGDGTFQPRHAFPTVMPVSLLASDLDADGDPEIVVGSNSGRMSLVVRSCSGAPTVYAGAMAAGGVYVAAGDLDGDGRPEVVSSSGYPSLAAHRLWLYGALQSVTFALEDPVRDLAVGDVDGDGRPDVLVATPSGVYPLLARSP